MFGLRIDRGISVAVSSMTRMPERGAQSRLPVLMYHSVSTDREDGVHPYYCLNTSPARFAEQMEWLAKGGWRGVSLSEGLTLLARSSDDNRNVVAITFDDGFADFLTFAWPVLARHGFKATMYLPTGSIGSSRQQFLGRHCLTWSEIRELDKQGIEFGSHTVTHPKLQFLPTQDLSRELQDSKESIEQELKKAVAAFAHPYAFPQEDQRYVARLNDALNSAGYSSCVTTRIGRVRAGDEKFSLKRLPVNNWDDAALLRAKLAGAYDWLAWFQSGRRLLRRPFARQETSIGRATCSTVPS